MQNCKLVCVGDGGAGKSCLLIQYTTGSFPGEYTPTVFDNFSANVMVDGKPINLGLWDTAGQEDYDRLRPLSYPQTDVFLACFAIGNRTSLRNIEARWLPEIRHHCPDVPVLIVGCKSDLSNAGSTNAAAASWSFSEAEACALIKRTGAIGYKDCSALQGLQTREVFDEAIRHGLQFQSRSSAFKQRKGSRVKVSLPLKPLPPVMPPTGRAPWIYPTTSTLSQDFGGLLPAEAHAGTSTDAPNSVIRVATDASVKFPGTHQPPLGVHRVILDSADPLFLASIESDQQGEDKQNSPDVVAHLVEWLYTGRQRSLETDTYVEGTATNSDDNAAHNALLQRLRDSAVRLHLEELITYLDNIQQGLQEFNASFSTYVPDRTGRRAYEAFLRTNKLCDVEIFLVDSQECIQAHQAVLSSRSAFFRAALRWRSGSDGEDCVANAAAAPGAAAAGEASRHRVELSELSKPELHIILRVLYTDNVDWEQDVEAADVDYLRLLQLSDRFDLSRLKSLTELKISKLADAAIAKSIAKSDVDVVSLLNAASQYNCKQLEAWCLFFLSSNFNAMSQSSNFLETLSPEHRDHVTKHRWPPQQYLRDVETYNNVTIPEWKKRCAEIKRSNKRLRSSATRGRRCAIM